jgi:hypothetical protein
MFPYQIYQALSDQRMHDLRAEARRHEQIAQARLARANTQRSSRLKDVVRHLEAVLHISTRAATSGLPARSTTTSASTAGPMGCIA